MVTIINRNPTGRLISLHSLIKYLFHQYGENVQFGLNDMKFDKSKKYSILDFFPLAKTHPTTGKLYDPYLENPFSKAGSHLTQGVDYDSQKSKSVSDCANALHGLGLIKPIGNKYVLTHEGVSLARVSYDSPDFLKIIRESLMNYGPFVGFLYQCYSLSNHGIIEREKIDISYPTFDEVVLFNGKRIVLSAGSQRDTITRTRSVLFSWAITSGFAIPVDEVSLHSENAPQTSTLPLIAQKDWKWRKFKTYIPGSLFDGERVIKYPLDYKAMTKSTKALRERGQDDIRKVTMSFEEIIRNRRYAIVYSLAVASQTGQTVQLSNLIANMMKYQPYFVIDKTSFADVVNKELAIAIPAGIPFVRMGQEIRPLTRIDSEGLLNQLPDEVAEVFMSLM